MFCRFQDAWNALCTVTLPAQLEVLDLWFQHFPSASAEDVTLAIWPTVQERLLQKHSALQHVRANIIPGSSFNVGVSG